MFPLFLPSPPLQIFIAATRQALCREDAFSKPPLPLSFRLSASTACASRLYLGQFTSAAFLRSFI